MVWKSKSPRIEAKPSTFRQLLPLLILLVVVGGAGFVGYQIYLSVAKIRESTEKRMAKKNVIFTKDGLQVGVKHVEQESYVDATQSWVVKAWNMSTPNSAAVKRK